MSIVPSISVSASTMVSTNPLDAPSPATPPTKSSGPDTGPSMSSSLPSPPPSSSSRHSHPHDLQRDQDQRDIQEGDPTIDRIARRLSPSGTSRHPSSTTPHLALASDIPVKTHSSSSSVSSSTSNHHPNKLSVPASGKAKTLGHLTRSTSSEVDSEMANALASGRSIVSKTDWKEEDAHYLVQLIEKQFPKGNIIWDWVGQQMANRGFSKSQCRSKWKRIRTKVLHGNDPSHRDRDARDLPREHEPDELIEEEDDDMGDDRPPMTDSRQEQWHHRQDYDRSLEGSSYPDSYRPDPYGAHSSYDRHRNDPYYQEREYRDNYRARSPSAPSHPSSGRRTSVSHHSGRQPIDRSGVVVEEDELWSDDEQNGRHDHYMGGKRLSQDYQPRDHSHHRSGAGSSHHHRRQPSSAQVREDAEDSARSLSAIAATPTSFGKIEWKPEDSDFLVRLIETKFASRKVDWAWVSKQMEGRGYDRTQCKSRWWRVQHRQNQANQQSGPNQSSSTGQSPPRNKQRESVDQGVSESSLMVNGPEDSKAAISDDEALQSGDRSPRQRSVSEHETIAHRGNQSDEPDAGHHRKVKDRLDDDEAQGAAEGRGTSPRPTRTHEHQKHIEWKEEDSQYMYRLIEKEFPVGNIIWSVIAEKMQSRGYSQTQCMSKWRRHLKNSKLANEGGKMGASMDLDVDLEGGLNDSRMTGFRRRGQDDRLPYNNDTYSDGPKRFRRDGVDSRRYDRSTDFAIVDPTDARLVEMEYDRVYDAGGKRRRTETEGLRSETEAGYPYHGRHSPTYGDYRDEGRDEGRYPQDMESTMVSRGHHLSNDTSPALATRETETIARSAFRDESSREHADPPETEYPPSKSYRGADGFGREEDAIGATERESHSSGKYRNPPSSTANEPYPQRWPDERRGEGSADHSQAYAGRPRSPSASSTYRDIYDANHGYPGEHGTGDHVSRRHSYSRTRDPMLDQSEARHRPHESEYRGRPTGRSSEQSTMANSSKVDPRRPMHHEGQRGHEYPPVDSNAKRYPPRPNHDHENDYEREYDYDNDHHGRRGGKGHHSQRPRQDYDRDSEYVDYALEDDMDWAAGKWESRDMARLAAAVARQGRRWDAIRTHIRIPVVVSPYDDVDDIYEGMRFDPHPSLHSYPYDESRKARQHASRPSSSLPGSQGTSHHRYPSTSGSRYGASSSSYRTGPGPSGAAERRGNLSSEQRSKPGHRVTSQSVSASNEPLQVDLTMDDAEEPGNRAASSGYNAHRYDRNRAGDEEVVDVVSIEANEGGAQSEVAHRGHAALKDQEQDFNEARESVEANRPVEEMDVEEMSDAKDEGAAEGSEGLNAQQAEDVMKSRDLGPEADGDSNMAL